MTSQCYSVNWLERRHSVVQRIAWNVVHCTLPLNTFPWTRLHKRKCSVLEAVSIPTQQHSVLIWVSIVSRHPCSLPRRSLFNYYWFGVMVFWWLKINIYLYAKPESLQRRQHRPGRTVAIIKRLHSLTDDRWSFDEVAGSHSDFRHLSRGNWEGFHRELGCSFRYPY